MVQAVSAHVQKSKGYGRRGQGSPTEETASGVIGTALAADEGQRIIATTLARDSVAAYK